MSNDLDARRPTLARLLRRDMRFMGHEPSNVGNTEKSTWILEGTCKACGQLAGINWGGWSTGPAVEEKCKGRES
jgi:hypothetical protein